MGESFKVCVIGRRACMRASRAYYRVVERHDTTLGRIR